MAFDGVGVGVGEADIINKKDSTPNVILGHSHVIWWYTAFVNAAFEGGGWYNKLRRTPTPT